MKTTISTKTALHLPRIAGTNSNRYARVGDEITLGRGKDGESAELLRDLVYMYNANSFADILHFMGKTSSPVFQLMVAMGGSPTELVKDALEECNIPLTYDIPEDYLKGGDQVVVTDADIPDNLDNVELSDDDSEEVLESHRHDITVKRVSDGQEFKIPAVLAYGFKGNYVNGLRGDDFIKARGEEISDAQ